MAVNRNQIKSSRQSINKHLCRMASTPIPSPITEQEPKPLPERKALDDIVFDALGLIRRRAQGSLPRCLPVGLERISKAESVRRNG